MTHPARWFAIAAVVLLILTPAISWVMASAGDVDLTLHDTYYVLPRSLVCLMMAALLALFAGAYSFLPFRPQVAAWHFWMTGAGVAVYWLSFYLWGASVGERLGTQALTSPAIRPFETAIAGTFVLATLVVLLSPAILFVNLALGWARSRRVPSQA
jgi:heme/copper-type cytochrome/quinol oxidase subunit 1